MHYTLINCNYSNALTHVCVGMWVVRLRAYGVCAQFVAQSNRLTYFLFFVALVIDEFRTEERSSLERAFRASAAPFFWMINDTNPLSQFAPAIDQILPGIYLVVFLRIIDFVAVRNVSRRPRSQHWYGTRYCSGHRLFGWRWWRRLWSLHRWFRSNWTDFVTWFWRTSWI